MSTRIALISDVHGNAPALQAVLDDIQACGCQRIVMLGDIVNGVEPARCVDLLRALPNLTAIKGNAEWYVLTPELAAFPLRATPRFADVFRLTEWWLRQLSGPQLEWLQALPDLLVERGLAQVHDSPLDRQDPARRAVRGLDPRYHEFCFHARGIHPEIDDGELAQLGAWMAAAGATELFCGHTHVPFVRSLERWQLCNAGSVGMPLDGDPRAAWVLMTEDEPSRRQICIRRVVYPVAETIAQVERAASYPAFEHPGRQAAYKQMLRTGIHWRVHMG